MENIMNLIPMQTTSLLLLDKLEIGSGARPQEGYIHMDVIQQEHVEVIWDANQTPYPFENERFNEIYLHWVLEHFSMRDIDRILLEWYRLLKPGGFVHAITGNVEAHNKCLLEGKITWEEWNRLIFGISLGIGKPPVSVYECHKIAWNVDLINKLFGNAGFRNITVNAGWACREKDNSIKCPGLIIKAYK